MHRKLLTRAAAGFAILTLALPADASEASALAISANIQATHLPYGTILDPIYAAPPATRSSAIPAAAIPLSGPDTIWRPRRFATKSPKSPDALANVEAAIAGIKVAGRRDRDQPAGPLPGSL